MWAARGGIDCVPAAATATEPADKQNPFSVRALRSLCKMKPAAFLRSPPSDSPLLLYWKNVNLQPDWSRLQLTSLHKQSLCFCLWTTGCCLEKKSYFLFQCSMSLCWQLKGTNLHISETLQLILKQSRCIQGKTKTNTVNCPFKRFKGISMNYLQVQGP